MVLWLVEVGTGDPPLPPKQKIPTLSRFVIFFFTEWALGDVPFFKDYRYQFCTPSIYLPTQVKGFEGELKQVLDKAVSTFSFSMVVRVPNFHFFSGQVSDEGLQKMKLLKKKDKKIFIWLQDTSLKYIFIDCFLSCQFWNPSVFSKCAKYLSCEVLTQFCEIFDINSENWHQVNRILDQSNSLPGQGSLFRLEMW